MSRLFRLAVLIVILGASTTVSYPTSADTTNQKISNDMEVQGLLTLPNSKMQRGETFYELVLSDAEYERAKKCSGSYGLSAFKVVGQSEEWERKFTTNPGFGAPNGEITLVASDGRRWFSFVNQNGSPVKIGGISTWIYVNHWDKKIVFNFFTTGWKGGEYTVIGFVSDGCRDYTMISKKFSLPEIPKVQLNCSAPSDVYMRDAFSIKCEASAELAANAIVVLKKTGKDWEEVASSVGTGTSFSIENLKTDELGLQEFQVKLTGIQDLIQDSVSNSVFVQSNTPKLSLKPILIVSKASKDKAALIKLEAGNNQLSGLLQSSTTPNGPWINAGTISSSSTLSSDLPFGTWVRIKYDGNSAINAGVSDPFQILITPTLSCTFPTSIESKKKFSVGCSSNQSLQPTPINLQYLDSAGNWVSIDRGTATGSKPTFTFNLEGLGNQKLRIRSEGLRDFYTSFSSNSSSVNFKGTQATSSGNSNLGGTSIPKGKVDKGSNAYKAMYNFGRNLAANSLASDTAQSQCLSAKNSGLVKVRGIPQYLGIQATQIQSYLATASGFQGCLDGFGN